MKSAVGQCLLAVAIGAVSGVGTPLGASGGCDPLPWGEVTFSREAAFGFCPPLDAVFRARIQLKEGACPVEYLFESSILEEGVRGKDACLENVMAPEGIDCVKETQLPPRVLTEQELSAHGVLSTVFRVLFEKRRNEADPNCGAIDPCLIAVFNLDGSLRVSDDPCAVPRVAREDAQVLVDLLERLRRAGDASPSPYFPLAVGNRWAYVVQHHVFSGTREVSVEGQEDGLYLVRTRSSGPGSVGEDVRLRASGNEIDIELPGGGLGPYYRFDEVSWVHRDPFECDDNSLVTVTSRDEVVDTPAGVFRNCLKLEFAGHCTDAGTIVEWWAPGVGLVKSEEDNIAGAVTWLLSDFEVALPVGEFLRGDANDDGRLELADAVRTLNFLFLGAAPVACPDAADSNDDGDLNIADPIHALTFLFLGGRPPPAPFPAAGPDPTADTLGSCRVVPIWYARPDGCVQCDECRAPEVETVVMGLEAAGIDVLAARWGEEASCDACGCPSGRVYLVLVAPGNVATLEAMGWRRFTSP